MIKFVLRGAPISDDERKELNLKAGRLFESHGVRMVLDDYKKIRERKFVGYAHYFLKKCWNKSELKNKADVTIYKQLLEIDSKLGTNQSEQLLECVFYSLRMALIKVLIYF